MRPAVDADNDAGVMILHFSPPACPPNSLSLGANLYLALPCQRSQQLLLARPLVNYWLSNRSIQSRVLSRLVGTLVGKCTRLVGMRERGEREREPEQSECKRNNYLALAVKGQEEIFAR